MYFHKYQFVQMMHCRFRRRVDNVSRTADAILYTTNTSTCTERHVTVYIYVIQNNFHPLHLAFTTRYVTSSASNRRLICICTKYSNPKVVFTLYILHTYTPLHYKKKTNIHISTELNIQPKVFRQRFRSNWWGYCRIWCLQVLIFTCKSFLFSLNSYCFILCTYLFLYIEDDLIYLSKKWFYRIAKFSTIGLWL